MLKQSEKVLEAKDADGKPIEIGCSLRSKMFPKNQVVCLDIVVGGVWLIQDQAGSLSFFVKPGDSQWVVFKYPDKKKGARS